MKNLQIGSLEFYQACKEATIKAYEGKVSKETLDGIVNLIPNPSTNGVSVSCAGDVNLTAAFIYGTVVCELPSKHKTFQGEHWGLGLAGFRATGTFYSAYSSWEAVFDNATFYHVQCLGAAAGIVQVNWFNKDGVPVAQFNGIAGGLGAMQVGGKGSWK